MEVFKGIKDYEGLYEISDKGSVKSLSKGDGNGYEDRILKQESIVKSHTTYKRVSLSKNGVVVRKAVHRLVATAFIPNINNSSSVNHIDNNGSNNIVENLEWCSHSENMKHSYKQGRTGLEKAWETSRKLVIKSAKEFYKEFFVGINFIMENTKYRSYITFKCSVCDEVSNKRSDSSLAKIIVCSRKCKTVKGEYNEN